MCDGIGGRLGQRTRSVLAWGCWCYGGAAGQWCWQTDAGATGGRQANGSGAQLLVLQEGGRQIACSAFRPDPRHRSNSSGEGRQNGRAMPSATTALPTCLLASNPVRPKVRRQWEEEYVSK